MDCMGGGGGGGTGTESLTTDSLSPVQKLCKGDSYPEMCAQRSAEGGGISYVVVCGRAETGFLCIFFFLYSYISLRDERRNLENKTNKQTNKKKTCSIWDILRTENRQLQ
jgi:hypothetical protein